MDHDTDPRLPLEATLYQVKKTIVGQDGLLERMLVALLARGHLLVEGVPGLAKTMAIKTLAQAIGGQFQRIQFTSDLVPADVVGTRIYNQRAGEFQVSLGPVFTNLLLADEINRAPAKVQSALLEVMQERQVTIGRETYPAPDPFLVMATQNPIESEGTYPLPEAQLDRFMFKVLVGYPTATQEYVVVERMTTAARDAGAGDRRRDPARAPARRRRRVRRPADHRVRRAAEHRDPRPGRGRAGRPGPVRDVRGQPAGVDQHGARRQGAGVPARPRLRPARRRPGAGPRRAAAPHRAVVRGARRRRLARRRARPAARRGPAARAGPTPSDLHGAACPRAARDGAGRPRRAAGGAHARSACCAGWSGGCCAVSTGGCRATTGRCSAAPASTSRTCASTSSATTCATSTGTSPRARTSRTCASTSRTARSPPGCCSTRSASMDFGPVQRHKHVVLTEVAATVAQLLSRGGNRVGALLFDTGVGETIPPASRAQPGAADPVPAAAHRTRTATAGPDRPRLRPCAPRSGSCGAGRSS